MTDRTSVMAGTASLLLSICAAGTLAERSRTSPKNPVFVHAYQTSSPVGAYAASGTIENDKGFCIADDAEPTAGGCSLLSCDELPNLGTRRAVVKAKRRSAP